MIEAKNLDTVHTHTHTLCLVNKNKMYNKKRDSE